MNRKQIVISCVALCFCATSANADLFGFTVNQLNTVYTSVTSTTGTFTASKTTGVGGSIGSLTGLGGLAPGPALFLWFLGDTGDFNLSMNISGITASTATGTGSFSFKDTSSPFDEITGDISGKWSILAGANSFGGVLSNVLYADNSADGTFDGGAYGFPVDMGFLAPLPWNGAMTQLTATVNNFFVSDFSVTGGSIDAVVTPLPSAILLGILGLGTAGFGLRRRLA